jgi:hypothetical protein
MLTEEYRSTILVSVVSQQTKREIAMNKNEIEGVEQRIRDEP